MSLTFRTLAIVLAALALCTANAGAQLFTDQGALSGSGLTFMPTASVAPTAEMQVQFTRLGLTQSVTNRLNIIGLTWGLSPSLEGYCRLNSEEVGTVSSQVSYSVGGKFRFPGSVPVLRRFALWGEATVSDMNAQDRQLLFPTQSTRFAAIASIDSNGFRPSFLAGASRVDGIVRPLLGAGLTIALGHRGQLGVEFVSGYLGRQSTEAMVTGSVRVFSNVSLHVSPGYTSTPALKSWMIGAGISLTTIDVDYHQVQENSENKDEYIIPSIEDLEKKPDTGSSGKDNQQIQQGTDQQLIQPADQEIIKSDGTGPKQEKGQPQLQQTADQPGDKPNGTPDGDRNDQENNQTNAKGNQ